MEAIANYILHYYSVSSSDNNYDDSTGQMQHLWEVLQDVQDNQGTDFYQDAEYFDDILWSVFFYFIIFLFYYKTLFYLIFLMYR